MTHEGQPEGPKVPKLIRRVCPLERESQESCGGIRKRWGGRRVRGRDWHEGGRGGSKNCQGI
jgi:hypothetical protein